MQRVCEVAGGVKAYVACPDCLLCDENRRCPFCDDRHRLRLHGWYQRILILEDSGHWHRIPVRRLFCPRSGRTVSLLPDFCLPGRQHSPGVLVRFLEGILKRLSLLAALRAGRPDAGAHSVAQSLLRSFLEHGHHILTYLSTVRARMIEPSGVVPGRQKHLATLVVGLTWGFPSPERAFEHHGRLFHERFGLSLA